jgi:hypothetical protein
MFTGSFFAHDNRLLCRVEVGRAVPDIIKRVFAGTPFFCTEFGLSGRAGGNKSALKRRALSTMIVFSSEKEANLVHGWNDPAAAIMRIF